MFDPRDLDERGLLLSILQELQSIRQLLEEQAPAEVTISQAISVPEPEPEPARRWKTSLGFMMTLDQFMAQPEVDSVVQSFHDAAFGGLRVVYMGRKLPDAEEV